MKPPSTDLPPPQRPARAIPHHYSHWVTIKDSPHDVPSLQLQVAGRALHPVIQMAPKVPTPPPPLPPLSCTTKNVPSASAIPPSPGFEALKAILRVLTQANDIFEFHTILSLDPLVTRSLISGSYGSLYGRVVQPNGCVSMEYEWSLYEVWRFSETCLKVPFSGVSYY